MPRHILIIDGHPDPNRGRLCHALAKAYEDGAKTAGLAVDRITVADIDFPWLHSQADFEQGVPPAAIRLAQSLIEAADHIVIIYPLWLGTMPAVLKAFLEQVLRPGFAMDYGSGKFPKGALTGKSARIVVTMGMPALVYRWFFGAHSLKSLERNILKFCGIRPVRETLFGLVDAVDDHRRKAWLDKMRALGRDGG